MPHVGIASKRSFMMDEAKQRKVATWVPLTGVGSVVIFLWVSFLLKRYGGIDFVVGTKEDPGGLFYLIPALLLTVIGPIVAWVWVKRNLYLLDHGVRVHARIESSGLWGSGVSVLDAPSVPVTFAYVVDGKEYKVRKDLPKPIVEKYRPDTSVQVCADRKNPKRCLILV
jgi:hypothetical protein